MGNFEESWVKCSREKKKEKKIKKRKVEMWKNFQIFKFVQRGL